MKATVVFRYHHHSGCNLLRPTNKSRTIQPFRIQLHNYYQRRLLKEYCNKIAN